jgi:LuxR family maltose regulon positive regulatory protein
MSGGACLAVAACLCLRDSHRDSAREYLDSAVALLSTARATPWWYILLAILCARVSLGLGQTQQAQRLVLEAERELARYPDSGMLSHWLAREQRALEAAWGGVGILGEPLTEAELRVLELAPTYLTLEEIGRCLCISRNTVKTHLKVIYSKLNVSSRGEAVERAQAMGLLGHHPTRIPKRSAA